MTDLTAITMTGWAFIACIMYGGVSYIGDQFKSRPSTLPDIAIGLVALTIGLFALSKFLLLLFHGGK